MSMLEEKVKFQRGGKFNGSRELNQIFSVHDSITTVHAEAAEEFDVMPHRGY
jgi:hypothetical protein